MIAKGGKGGFGNAHFKSSTRQAPRVAEKGEPGEELEVTLELKMIADVGLVGLPNAGKSTFLSLVSAARPEIADYPFTTLKPNLGVAEVYGKNLLIADIPGLIEGASFGKGLGIEFLRHVERTKVLIHLVDATSASVAKDYKIIRNELKSYKIDLTKKPFILALSKSDQLLPEELDAKVKEVRKEVPSGTPIYSISSINRSQVQDVLAAAGALAWKTVPLRSKKSKPQVPVLKLVSRESDFAVKKIPKGFLVTGTKIERFAKRTNFGDEFSEERMVDIMRKNQILKELHRAGAKQGSVVIFGVPEIGRMRL